MISSCRCRVARRLVDAAGGLVLIMANGRGWMACGMEAKGREVEDGTKKRMGRRGEMGEEKRGAMVLVYWIYLGRYSIVVVEKYYSSFDFLASSCWGSSVDGYPYSEHKEGAK